MRSAVRKMGNSSGVIIPKPLLAAIGAKAGDSVEVTAANGQLVIVPVRSHARSGWADDARAIAQAADDRLIWADFPTEDDATWTW
jgi:antitoxin MazE